MGTHEEFESALMRHFKERRFNEFLRTIARTPHYLPERHTKGRAVIFHGYSGHSEQPPIQHLVQVLKRKERFSISTCDFPHHGLSNHPDKEANLGKIVSFRQWVFTVYVMTYKTLMLRSKEPLGVFLIGYSAGALAILRFLQLYPEVQKYLAGVILVSVPLEVDQNASALVQKYKRFLEPVFNMVAWLLPNLPVGKLPEGDKEDKLEYHGKVKAGPAKEIRNAVRDARTAMKDITVPILFIHGDMDDIALSGPVEVAYRSAGTPDDRKQFIVYKGVPHKILHHAVKDIQEWITERNKAKDWVPVQRKEGMLNDAVKLSSIWFFAITETLHLIVNMLLRWVRNLALFFRKCIRRD